MTTPTRVSSSSTFPRDFEQAMNRLRGALTELLVALEEDPSQPQELSRHCGINKNLAWKVCKLINSTDSYGVAQHVPGRQGLGILLRAVERRGVHPEVLAQVRAAFEGFESMIELHVGDRGNLELYVGSTRPEGVHASQLEPQRRMAYQGNSVIWGVQARLLFTLKAISPTRGREGRADLTVVGGLLGFRRLRPTVSWPLLRQLHLSQNVELPEAPLTPIDPDAEEEPDGAPLVREFCSRPLPATRTHRQGDTRTYEICEGPVGRTAAVDLTYGYLQRDEVPSVHEDPDSRGEHYCRVDTPVEMLQFDLLVHRSLPFELPPLQATYAPGGATPAFPLSGDPRLLLPAPSTVQPLGSSPAGFATPHFPRYAQLLHRTCERIGAPLEEFQGYRVTLSYPPLSSILVMYHPLGRIGGPDGAGEGVR